VNDVALLAEWDAQLMHRCQTDGEPTLWAAWMWAIREPDNHDAIKLLASHGGFARSSHETSKCAYCGEEGRSCTEHSLVEDVWRERLGPATWDAGPDKKRCLRKGAAAEWGLRARLWHDPNDAEAQAELDKILGPGNARWEAKAKAFCPVCRELRAAGAHDLYATTWRGRLEGFSSPPGKKQTPRACCGANGKPLKWGKQAAAWHAKNDAA